MIRIGYLTALVTTVAAVVLFTATAAQAGAPGKVKRIDDATLGALITDEDNRLVLSFMRHGADPASMNCRI